MLLLILAVHVIIASSAVTAIDYEGYGVISVGPLVSGEDARFIETLRDEGDRQVLVLQDYYVRGSSVDLLVSPDHWEEIHTALGEVGLEYTLQETDIFQSISRQLIEDVMLPHGLLNVPLQQDPGKPEVYMDYGQTVAWLQQAADEAEDVPVQLVEFENATAEGRSMYIMEINPEATDLPYIWLDGGIHSREWISHATVIWIVHEIIFGTADIAVDMRTNYRWAIMPVVNPDGYEYTFSTDRFWRKNRQTNTGSPCVGIDLNRNFDAAWTNDPADDCSTSDDPCSDVYAGSGPASSPEISLVQAEILTRAEDLRILFSLHSYGQFWLVPWSASDAKPEDYEELEAAATSAAEAAENATGSVFRVGTGPDILYRACGATMDWAKNGNPPDLTGSGASIKYSYALELRPASTPDGGFLIPPRNIDPSGQEVLAGIAATLPYCCELV